MDKDSDILGNLPGHIQDKILLHLPIRDAIRTSMLSRKWRYKWTMLPHLVFDGEGLPISSHHNPPFLNNRVVNIVDHILLLHDGPIQKFKLSHKNLLSVSDIDRWILHLSRKAIKEFIFDIWKGEPYHYRIPSCLFSYHTLVHLELFNCLLNPPTSFKGFKNLKILDLQSVTITQNALENFIYCCPLLERLKMVNINGLSNLKIESQMLRYLFVGGSFKSLNFVNPSSLFEVSINLSISCGNYETWAIGSSNLCIFFHHLPLVENLEIRGKFLKHLAADFIPEMLPASNVHLKFLSVHINSNDSNEILACLCVLRSSPNLQTLEILVRSNEMSIAGETSVVMKLEKLNETFSHLQLVHVAGISGTETEMDFIRFLLLASPALKKMIINPALSCEGTTLLKRLLRYRRISEHAEIIYMDQ